MTLQDMQTQITKAVNDYDSGRLTLLSLGDIVRHTIEDAYKIGYKDGLLDAEVDGDYEEMEFDSEIDLDEFKEDE